MNLRRALILGFAGAFAICAAAGWLYSRNALFRLTDITVRSDDPDLSQSVRRRLTDFYGRSLFSVSLSNIERDVMGLAPVQSVAIHRQWPSGLIIDIEMKKPVAIRFVGKKLWTISVDGEPIEILRRPQTLPLLKSLPRDAAVRASVLAWLDRARHLDVGALNFSQVDEVRWDSDRGLVLKNDEMDLEIEMGFVDFDQAWERADQAVATLKAKNIRVQFLDATYRHRVVARLTSRLPNFANGLNSKELVRRTGTNPSAR